MMTRKNENIILISSVDENGNINTMKSDENGNFHSISHEDAVAQGFGLGVDVLKETTLHFMKQSGVSSGLQFAQAFRMGATTSVVSFVVYNKDAVEKYDDKSTAFYVATAQTAGNALFSMSGAMLGAELGGVAGSVVPVVGTGAGAVGGGLVGGFAFGIAYDEAKVLGTSLKDIVGDFTNSALQFFNNQEAGSSSPYIINAELYRDFGTSNSGTINKIGNTGYAYFTPQLDKIGQATQIGINAASDMPSGGTLSATQNTETQQSPSIGSKLWDTVRDYAANVANVFPTEYVGQLYSEYVMGIKEVSVKKGDTVWKIAKNSGLTVDQLLAIPGNEYLGTHRYKDDFGRDNVKIQPGYKIYTSTTHGCSDNIWGKQSNYGSTIKTTNGFYDFLSPFNMARYTSPYLLDNYLYKPFSTYSNAHYYDKRYADTMDYVRGMQYTSWKYDDFTRYQFEQQHQYGKEQKVGSDSSKNERSFQPSNHYDIGVKYSNPIYSSNGFSYGRYEEGAKIVYGDNWVAVNGNWGTFVVGGGGSGLGMFSSHPAFGFKVWPIIIDLDGDNRVSLIDLQNSTAFYDVDDSGFLKNLGWVDSNDGILSIDVNSDEVISLAKEISFKLWHDEARSDLEGLRLAFDDNQDGVVDAQDSKYSQLRIWQDLNKNGVSEIGEVRDLSDYNIEAILLDQVIANNASELTENSILKAVNINRNGKAVSGAFDVAFQYSYTGLTFEEDFGRITLRYSNEQAVKIYKVEDGDNQAVDLRNTDYQVALGSNASDTIRASDKGFVIDSFEGDDHLFGGDGNDWLKGGEGSDSFQAGKGHDVLLIDAADREEDIDAGEDFDVVLVATQEGVKLNLKKANIEAAYGNNGDDSFSAAGSMVEVYIDGGKGNDVLEGSDHNDILVGGEGNDRIIAGKGDDSLFIDSEDDSNFIDAGEGKDSVFVYGKNGVSLDANKINAEYIFGSLGNDYLYSSGLTNVTLVGNDGNDRIVGGSGDDILDGGKGNDTLDGGLGNDKYVFYVGAGHEVISNLDSKDNDMLVFLSSIKRNDIIFSRQADDLMILLKNNNKDSVTIKDWYKLSTVAEASNKLARFIINADTNETQSLVFKDDGDNSFRMGNGQEWIIFAMSGNDKIGGGDLADYINGGEGNDELIGWEGSDILVGGLGDDYLQGRNGDDTYVYNIGDGKDIIYDDFREIEIQRGTERRTRVETVHKQIDSHCFSTPGGFSHCFPVMGNVNYNVDYDVPFEKTIEHQRDGGNDTLAFGNNVQIEHLRFSRANDDLVVDIMPNPNNTGQIIIKNWLKTENKIENIIFNDQESNGNCFTSFVLEQGLVCPNNQVSSVYMQFNSAYKLSEHIGKAFAKAAIRSDNYIRVTNSECQEVAEIHGGPSLLNTAYLDEQGAIIMKLSSCSFTDTNHVGYYHFYKEATVNNTEAIISELQQDFINNQNFKTHHFWIYNGKGEVVAEIYGTPTQFNQSYIGSGLHGELHIAYDAY